MKLFILLYTYVITDCVWGLYREKQNFDLYMPDVTPTTPNLYLCTPVKINPDQSYYITGFDPHASMDTVHHMILYGCATPGLAKSVWNCGEMSMAEDTEETAPPCAAESMIVYAWARDAPKLELPDGVAFKIGKDSRISYLVLQIHYGHVDKFKDGSTDRSGLLLNFVETPMPRAAGVLLLGTGGRIPKYSLESMETQCPIQEDKVIHPFAFRVHTHELGVRVAGYRVRDIEGVEYWTLIGERDPLLPQMFFPISDDIVIRKNDRVAATCKMDATRRNRTTTVGATSDDEMCNFYLMYWVEDTGPLETQYCFSPGPPMYYWNFDFRNIPQKEVAQYFKNEVV